MTVSSEKRRSPMRGKYLVQSRVFRAYLSLLDLVLHLLRRRAPDPGRATRRIVVSIGGHLGDAILATSVLPVIKRAFPDAEIGIVAASWSRPAFDGHPDIRWFHCVDHWRHNRSVRGAVRRLLRSIATHSQSLRELRAVGYDAAIDLYPFYPTMSVLFRRAGIPNRIGYESGGGGPAFTTPVQWVEGRHMAAKHVELAGRLTGVVPDSICYSLPPLSVAQEQDAAALLASRSLASGYVVLHPGTGDPRKAWPLDRWLALAKLVVATGRRVVVTGAGALEQEAAEWIRAREPAITDLSGRTTIPQLRGVLRRAAVVVASDSASGHLAAAENVPVISIMAAMSAPDQWKPLSPKGVVLTEQVACAPCFLPYGCEQMNCVRDVTVDAVWQAVTRSLADGHDA